VQALQGQVALEAGGAGVQARPAARKVGLDGPVQAPNTLHHPSRPLSAIFKYMRLGLRHSGPIPFLSLAHDPGQVEVVVELPARRQHAPQEQQGHREAGELGQQQQNNASDPDHAFAVLPRY
jgi:hypothetical protein